MSLLVRAALLGGLAYVVSRAVRKNQLSLDFPRSKTQRLARTPDYDDEELTPSGNPRSAIDVSAGA